MILYLEPEAKESLLTTQELRLSGFEDDVIPQGGYHAVGPAVGRSRLCFKKEMAGRSYRIRISATGRVVVLDHPERKEGV